MEKSFVTMAQSLCKVTGKPFDTGELLLDQKMRKRFEMKTVTGWGISPEVQEKLDAGYVAVVAIDPKRSEIKNDIAQPDKVWRTGDIAFVKAKTLGEILSQEITTNIAFVPQEFIDWLSKVQRSSSEKIKSLDKHKKLLKLAAKRAVRNFKKR